MTRRIQIESSHRFASMIFNGTKRQTTRRTLRCTPGDVLTFTLPIYDEKGIKVVPFEVICKAVQGIVFDPHGVILDGKALCPHQAHKFAKADGFIDFSEMLDWFFAKYRIRTFHGFLISW